MDDQSIQLIQSSFERIEQAELDYGDIFYETLFRDTPSAQALFNGDMDLQKRKLKTTIALVIKGLNRFSELQQAIYDLGKRHVDYGVHPEDFPDVADALIKTIETVLDEFTIEEENAWKEALGIVASEMLKAWSD